MAGRKVKSKQEGSNGKGSNGAVYLTKRILERLSRKAFSEAAKETMAVLGYNVIAEDGWVVKLYPDGSKERISKIKPAIRTSEVIFD